MYHLYVTINWIFLLKGTKHAVDIHLPTTFLLHLHIQGVSLQMAIDLLITFSITCVKI